MHGNLDSKRRLNLPKPRTALHSVRIQFPSAQWRVPSKLTVETVQYFSQFFGRDFGPVIPLQRYLGPTRAMEILVFHDSSWYRQ